MIPATEQSTYPIRHTPTEVANPARKFLSLAGHMKTIFIAIEQGFTARYLLRTSLFETLKQSGARIVILAPNADEPYFANEFRDKNVFIEKYEVDQYRFKKSRWRTFFTQARFYTYNSTYHVNVPHYWYKFDKKNRKVNNFAQRVGYIFFDPFVGMLRRFKLIRKLAIWFESAFFTHKVHTSLFEKYQPEALLVTSIGNFLNDCYIMREARYHKCKVVSAILSWDNTTTKGMAGALCDRVIAWTPVMKEELMQLHDIPEKKIFIGGVAYYDIYFNQSIYDKPWLIDRFQLTNDLKTILLCLMSPTQFRWNLQLVETVSRIIASNQLKLPAQLLVRPHPIYFDLENGKRKFEKEYNELRSLEKKYPFLHFDHLSILSRKISFDMPAEEMKKLGTILKYSDVLLCFFSSMMIEGSIFDVPIINLGLYEKNNLPLQIQESHDHARRVLDTGGVKTAYNEQDLTDLLNLYLEHPETDREGRQRVVANETGPNKGSAGEAIGTEILRFLGESKAPDGK